MKKMRAKWPKHLVIPSEKQFLHGDWIRYECPAEEPEDSDDCYRLEDAARAARVGLEIDSDDVEDLKYSCNTQCCLVGWTALAMNESSCLPEDLENMATAEFLNKFIELAGFTPLDRSVYDSDITYICATANLASDIFEGNGGGLFRGDTSVPIPRTKGKLSPRRARNLWKKTAEHFGYDTENLFG